MWGDVGAGRVDERGDVAQGVALALGDLEGPLGDGVGLPHGCLRTARGAHRLVEPPHVGGRDTCTQPPDPPAMQRKTPDRSWSGVFRTGGSAVDSEDSESHQ